MSTMSAKGLKALRNLKESLVSSDWSPKELDVDDWLVRACIGTTATVEEVKGRLLSPEDVMDILEGRTSFEGLKCHVQVWYENGKPNWNP